MREVCIRLDLDSADLRARVRSVIEKLVCDLPFRLEREVYFGVLDAVWEFERAGGYTPSEFGSRIEAFAEGYEDGRRQLRKADEEEADRIDEAHAAGEPS